MMPLGFLDFLGPSEMLIVAVVAVLLFGERLPEVARTWGKKFIDVKSKVQGIRAEFEAAAREVTSTLDSPMSRTSYRATPAENPDREEATAPKFEPPPPEPVAESH
jgi:sec-independent protein translocase protein TatA